MATFREMVYMVLDLLKETTDDAFYTEEHVLFLVSKCRALILERRYAQTRNSAFREPSTENTQMICLDLEPEELLPMNCGGLWLRSVQEIPDIINISTPKVFTVNDMLHSMVTFIPYERMPFVGYNKWLKNIIYAARSSDGHLYLQSNNPQFIHLQQAKMEAVFSDTEAAAELACPGDDGKVCDVLDQEFPLEAALIPQCVELVLQEMIGSRYAPQDRENNAEDDLHKAAVTNSKAPTVATEEDAAAARRRS
jgi:hypothetical protein